MFSHESEDEESVAGLANVVDRVETSSQVKIVWVFFLSLDLITKASLYFASLT
jgi:hypothetical protein